VPRPVYLKTEDTRPLRATLESIYREHRQGLFTLALSIVRNPVAAEDAVHEAFVRLCRRDRPPQADGVAYVFAAVRNAAVDVLRRRPAGAVSASIFRERAAPQDSPEAAAMMRERDGLLRQAVEDLPDGQREAVVMRLFAGLTFEQMAQVAGEPLSTVSTRYRRALEKLRKMLEMKV
jgi:RNA polymerase sigma-70 factor, ECF subfamily